MYFLKALKELPLSLILTTLAIANTAAGVVLQQLDPTNFTDITASGTWFVEHYSPYCSHCKKLAPTWEKLVEDAEHEFPTVHLAQVNCATYGDLCIVNGARGFPTMFLYEDGKKVDEYGGSRTLDSFKTFLTKHTTPPEPEEEPSRKLNINGQVLSIDNPTLLLSTLEGPAFVKFFAPWCGHCKRLAPTWVQLAADMKDKLTIAQVDCDAHSALCSAHKIQGYPSLIFFSKGMRYEYEGGRKLDQLKAFAEKAAEGKVHVLERDSDLKKLVDDHEVLYLMLTREAGSIASKHIRKASSSLLGQPLVYLSHSSDLFKEYNIPDSANWALLAFKDHELSKPASHLHGYKKTPVSDMEPWLLTHRLPGYLELSTNTFQSVMNAPQEPLVVIAALAGPIKDKAEAKLQQLAKEWKSKTGGSGMLNGKEVVFTWMDAEKMQDWLKRMYNIKRKDEDDLDDVQLIIADHHKMVYYDDDVSGHRLKLTQPQALFGAIERATAGRLHFKHSQSVIERLARYLNHKLAGTEVYVTAHPFKTVLFIVGGLVVLFYVLYKWLGSDMPTDKDFKTSRLD